MLDKKHGFPQPTGGRGDKLRRGLDDHRRISDTGHVYLLNWERFVSFLHKEAHFIPACYKLYLVAHFVGSASRKRCSTCVSRASARTGFPVCSSKLALVGTTTID